MLKQASMEFIVKKYIITITIITAIILAISYLTIYKLKKPEQVSDQSIMSLQDKAHDLAKKGKLKEAENLYLEAISNAKQLYGEKYCLAATPAYVRLSNLYNKQGRYDDAITQLKAAIKSYKNSVANVVLPINLLKLKILLASAYKNKQDYKNAEKYYLAVASHVEKLPLYVQYDYYIKYGDTCSWLGKYNKALRLIKKALFLQENHDSIKVGYIYTVLGHIYLRLHKGDKALIIFKKKLNLSIREYGANSKEAAENYFWVAKAYLFMKKIKQSKKMFHKSLSMLQELQSELVLVIMVYQNLADIANIYDKDKAQAIEFFQKAYEANSQLTQPIKEDQQPIKRIKLELQRLKAKPLSQ